MNSEVIITAKSQYESQRNASHMMLYNNTRDFVNYIFTITSNSKQFPDRFRYTLVDELRGHCLELFTELTFAMCIQVRSNEEYADLKNSMKRIRRLIVRLEALLNISMDVAKIKNPEHLSLLYSTMANEYTRWAKNAKRASEKTLKRIAYKAKKTKDQNEAAALRHKQYLEMEKDDDGYVILKRNNNS